MIKQTNIKQLLTAQGIAVVEPLYTDESITKWNEKLNPIIASQKQKRRYVSALELFDLGLFNDIFNEELLSLIFTLIPDAELYHCHVYEITGNQKKSHISADNKLDGWHRDVDCKHQFFGPTAQHISLFVYLSNVSNNGGYFEVSNKPYFPLEYGNQDTHYQLIGSAGTCFLFDRKAYHRASPNFSNTPRRVLKLSFQSRELFNHKQLEDIFKQVHDKIANENHGLRQLFGDKNETAHYRQYSKPATLPKHQSKSQFNTVQNFIRLVRDVRFLMRRIGAKLGLVNDKKTPKAKITLSKNQ